MTTMKSMAAAPDFYHLSFDEFDLEENGGLNGDEMADPHFQTIMHNEINRMVSENMLLQSKLDKQTGNLRSARARLKRLEAEGISKNGYSNGTDKGRLPMLGVEAVSHSALLHIQDLAAFVRILIPDLRPTIAALITPCLPAYLFITGLRVWDHEKDEAQLTQTFTAIHASLKDTVDKSMDSDVLALWLVNGWRLLNLLRQYGGEEEWSGHNKGQQCEHVFLNSDTASLREKLVLRVQDSYRNFMKRAVEPVLSPKVVPAILQHESARELFGSPGIPNGSNGIRKADEQALTGLLEFLNFIHSKLVAFGADSVLLHQIFGQIASWISAQSVNHLMFRRELCNFERAFEIKHNVTEIMDWLDKKGLGSLKERLEAVVQASHLLQSRKDDENLETLCGEMTSKLKPKQIVTLLKHYTSSDGIEPRLPQEFLSNVVEKLVETRGEAREETGVENGDTPGHKENPLMMETYLCPMDTRPFVYSEVALERLVLPPCLRLDQIASFL